MRQRKIVRLSIVRNDRKASEAKHIRHDMHAAVRSVCADFGDETSGYALVTWTRKGEVQSLVNQGYGPFGWGCLPEIYRDAINRHISIAVANPSSTIPRDDA